MGNLIAGRTVQRLHIIDDDEGARSSYVETFYNSRFETVSQGGVEDVEQFLALSIGPTDAIISDHQLKKRSYFPNTASGGIWGQIKSCLYHYRLFRKSGGDDYTSTAQHC